MDRTDKSNQKAGKEFGKGGQTGGARLVGKKMENVRVDPDTVNDTSDGMQEKDYLAKSNKEGKR